MKYNCTNVKPPSNLLNFNHLLRLLERAYNWILIQKQEILVENNQKREQTSNNRAGNRGGAEGKIKII